MKREWMKMAAKWLFLGIGAVCFCAGGAAFASGSGIGAVASQVTSNLSSVAKLVTAGSYVAGFAFGVGAIVKFKAHKDNPTTVPISQPIMLIFVAAALIFIPSVFTTTGKTLFGSSASQAGVGGFSSF